MRRVEQVGATIVEHGSPARGRRRNTQPEETHGGFGKHSAGHADGGLHDDGLNDVGKNMSCNDTPVAGAERPRGFEELPFLDRQNLRAHQTRVAYPPADAQRQNEAEYAWPE